MWQAQGILHPVKSEQNVRFCGILKNDDRCGTFEEDLQRRVQETCSSEMLGGQGACSLRGVAF